MAEYAQKAIEEMLPEVDRMRKIGLFSVEETRAMMKKRQRFEYKTQRRTKEKEVYLQYIQYEISVQQLVKLRREKRGIDVEKDRIEKPMVLRIYRLFRMACFRFKHDVKLWLTHIEFAKKNYDRERVSKLFTTMLKVHNKKPNLWIMAAKFEFEVNESVETARQLFQRALRLLPDKKKIWIEYFKMELMCVDLIMKRKELLGLTEQSELETNDNKNSINEDESTDKKIEDSILSCKIVEIVFINAIKQLEKNSDDKDLIHQSIPQLVFKMIKTANEFQFTENLIDRMYKFIEDDVELKKYEESWDLLARRSLLQEEIILRKCEQTGQCADFTIAEFEDKTNVVFLKALEEINTEKMHHIYLNFCIERLKLNSSFLNEERFTRLNDAFRKTQSRFQLPLDLTIEWIKTLVKFSKNSEAVEQIKTGLEKFNDSLCLWKLYLTIKIEDTSNSRSESSRTELLELFYKSIANVNQKNALELWKLIINWCTLNNYDNTEKILKEGSKVMNQEISSFSRLKYFEWSLHAPVNNIKSSGLSQVRNIYENLCQEPPFSVEFYLKYIEIEKCAFESNENRIVSAYEDALTHFSKQNIDLWIAYIEFVYSASNKKDLQQVSTIYWRAMKHLDTELIETFTQKFCFFKINIGDKCKQLISPDEVAMDE